MAQDRVTSSDDDELEMDFEDDSGPESGSPATAAQGINATAVTIVPGTVPTSEPKTVPTTTFPITSVPSTTGKTITKTSERAKLFAENNALPSSSVPTTAVSAVPSNTGSTEATTEQSEKAKLLTLLTKNSAILSLSRILLSDIVATNRKINWNLARNKESILLIRHAEGLMLNATRTLFSTEAELLGGIVKAIRKIDRHAQHTIDDVAYVMHLQDETKERIDRFSVKIGEIQNKILRSSQGFDKKLHRLGQILQQNIKFKVLNLNLTASRINTSQINSMAELGNLPIVLGNSRNSVVKLTSLEHQLYLLNKTQSTILDSLSEDVQNMDHTNLGTISDQHQSLIMSQKRTKLDLAVCDRESGSDIFQYYF
ncbi:uncharacterized protein DMAD_08526 [Drosophila madeirensis]|uniref:Uncharacterized protein n=1 Tax=Drosophila madeirensis TaxID=30013 RepID=A0AAU9F228_DROMD